VTVHTINPLTDTRWDEFLLRHRRASIFHSRGWLSALQQTYGYAPVVFTTSTPGGPLEDGVVFCEVKSWITGQRLVSLPFSDHCDPLIDSPAKYAKIWAHVREQIGRVPYKYAEVRPLSIGDPEELAATGLIPSEKFCLHILSLNPLPEMLFRGLHKDCIRRKVRRAEREELGYETGRSEAMLRKFYQLLVLTRRRHCLPPQPLEWFRHLISAFGDQLTIRIASKDDLPVAAILTLSFKRTTTYKYGCSDHRFSRLGGTPFLFWKTIQEARDTGMNQLDLGRSESNNAGLVRFKDRLGAARTPLTRFRYPSPTTREVFESEFRRMATKILRYMPAILLTATGRTLYRHFG
jgi:CelD/BcsL family acetyltransferase involved in cellulose biosynthesis